MQKKEIKPLILSSSFEEVERLEPYLNDIQSELGFNDDLLFRIRLAVDEAATNAIIHGNKEDPSKKVRISASVEDSILYVHVKDEGKGYNPDTLKNPTKEENLLRQSGRGIFLVKQYADEVTFSENATKLTMKFQL